MRKKLFSILALLLTVNGAWADNITVYFIDALGWGDVKVHYWGDSQSTEWPGNAMTIVGTNEYNQSVYEASIPGDVTGIVFNGNGKQTNNITTVRNGEWWYSDKTEDNVHYTYVSLGVRTPIFGATVTDVNDTDWTGSEIHPNPVVTLGETVLSSTSDYDVKYGEGCTNVGNYTVTIIGKGSYAGAISCSFNINNVYFLVGTMTGWAYSDSWKFVKNTSIDGDEYYINDVQFSKDVAFKVRSAEGVWYPGGSDNDYVIDSEGKYTVEFRPTGNVSGWYEGYFKVYKTNTVKLARSGYGTYYNSAYEVTLPEGVVAYILSGVNNGKPTYEKIADGNNDNKIVPAGTAMLLYSATVKSLGEDTEIALDLTPSSTMGNYSNLLHGSDFKTMTSGGNKYYKLTYGVVDDNTTFGWFWGEENGVAFTSPAHKAWLALPGSNPGARAFFSLPGDDFTGISTIENRQQNADNVWYDLNGRRINAPTAKGIYVKDGRKFVIK